MLWSWLLDVTWYDWVGWNWAGYAEYAGWVCVNSEHYGCWTPWTHHWLVSVVPAPDHVLTSLSPTTTSIQNIGGYKITKYIKTLCYATHVVTNRILGFVTLKHSIILFYGILNSARKTKYFPTSRWWCAKWSTWGCISQLQSYIVCARPQERKTLNIIICVSSVCPCIRHSDLVHKFIFPPSLPRSFLSSYQNTHSKHFQCQEYLFIYLWFKRLCIDFKECQLLRNCIQWTNKIHLIKLYKDKYYYLFFHSFTTRVFLSADR